MSSFSCYRVGVITVPGSDSMLLENFKTSCVLALNMALDLCHREHQELSANFLPIGLSGSVLHLIVKKIIQLASSHHMDVAHCIKISTSMQIFLRLNEYVDDCIQSFTDT